MQLFALPLMLLLLPALRAAVLPLVKSNETNTEKFVYLELKPNGTLILQRAPNQSGSNVENLLLLRSVLQALKLAPIENQAKLNIKIYGEGVEHKFPPMLENIIQRIQTYFSIYRYTDTSRPVRKDELITKPEVLELTTQRIKAGNDPIVIKKEDAYITVGED